MKKYLDFLPAFLISILTIRSVIFGAGIGDAIGIVGLSALMGYKLFLDSKETIEPTEELKKEVETIKNEMSKLSLSLVQKPKSAPVSFKW